MLSAKNKVRTAQIGDVPALRENWRLSFGDGDEYLDFFFARRFDPRLTPVAEADGRAVSQLFLLPVSLCASGKPYPAFYLFAAATHPAYRGRGLMASLLREAERMARSSGIRAIVLRPGDRGLYQYYAQNGYETAFVCRRRTVSRAELSVMAAAAPQRDNADFLYAFLSGRDGLCWDADALSYALEEHRRFRGPYAASENAFAAVCEDEADVLCAPEHFAEAAALVLRLSDGDHWTLRFPADMPFGEVHDGGMIRYLDGAIPLHNAFISFAME